MVFVLLVTTEKKMDNRDRMASMTGGIVSLETDNKIEIHYLHYGILENHSVRKTNASRSM